MIRLVLIILGVTLEGKGDPRIEVSAPHPITGDPVTITAEPYVAHFAKEGGVFQLGGYSHLLTVVKLSMYREAVKDSCGHLHAVAQQAHKPGLDHLFEAVGMLETRCKAMEEAMNSQLRSMGSDEDWRAYWKFPGTNPFSTTRAALPGRPTVVDTQVTTNQVTTTRMPAEAETVANWPSRFTSQYIEWCRAHETPAENKMCCVDKLFIHPEVENLSELPECDLLMIPEVQLTSPAYNPMFFPKEVLMPMYRNGSVGLIRSMYTSNEPHEVEERFAVAMALAGGALFGAALDGVLSWFGYSLHTTEDVKHINANQAHIDQVAEQVGLTEKFSRELTDRATNVEAREELTEKFLHMQISLQSLFDHLEMVMGGISTLFHHRRLSPLLVDRKSMMSQARALQVEQRGIDNVLMIAPGDVWHAPVSYVVTRDLNIHIMIHIPVGRTASYRKLFRYIPTPMSFDAAGPHFLVNPKDPYLIMDMNNQSPMEMSLADVERCKEVNHYRKYCPSKSFQVNRAPPSCLTALHAGDPKAVLALCPVVLVDEGFPHISDLAFGEFTLYTKEELTVKVFCGTVQEGTRVMKGLSRISLRRDCRIVHEDFVLEPMVDFTAQDHELAEIPLAFSEEFNMTDTLAWGSDRGLLRQMDAKTEGEGFSMIEVAHQWNHAKLDESIKWTWRMAMITGTVALFSCLICCCCTRECWNIYQRSRQRQAMNANIRAQVREVGHEMQDLLAAPSTVPSAPIADQGL